VGSISTLVVLHTNTNVVFKLYDVYIANIVFKIFMTAYIPIVTQNNLKIVSLLKTPMWH
jgi:hypothetical protein